MLRSPRSVSQPFDVVVVPDFSGRASLGFEARMLYFLASWIESSGAMGHYPLHLACIGEPPATVRTLAARAGAILSQHAPAPAALGVYANKLRGFEAPLQTERLLLVDADILVMGDLTSLVDQVPPDAIAAAPSHSAIILPEMWRELYARLALSPPAATMPDFHRTLDMAPLAPGSGLYPSVNSGVLLAPRRGPLHALWLEHLAVLGEYRPAWTPRLAPLDMLVGDEPALATALHVLRGQGVAIATLPDRYNGRWRHLYRRAPRMDELALFHMTSSFGHGATLPEKLAPRAPDYQKKLARRYYKRWLRHSTSHARDAVTHLAPALLELRRLAPRLQRLYDRHIRDVVGA